MLISIKRNNLFKTFENYQKSNADYTGEEMEKKYDTAYEAYLEALDKYVLDSYIRR